MKVFELMQRLGGMPAGAEVWFVTSEEPEPGQMVCVDLVEDDGDGDVRLSESA